MDRKHLILIFFLFVFLITFQAAPTRVNITELSLEEGQAADLKFVDLLHNFNTTRLTALFSRGPTAEKAENFKKYPAVNYVGQGLMKIDLKEKELAWELSETGKEDLTDISRRQIDERLQTELEKITGVGFLQALEEEHHTSSLLDQIETHVVRSGESLWTISSKYGINIDTLIGANDIKDMNRLMPGDELTILPVKGILYNIGPGENFTQIVRKFELDIEEVKEANDISNPDSLKAGDRIILPGAKPEFGYQDRLNQLLIRPVEGRISSPFGPRWGRHHDGKDYAVPINTPVKAAAGGTVVHVGRSGGYGNTVIIEHQRGMQTLYAHLNSYNVRQGQYVNRGQVIAYSGNTGRSTGPHLHFEVRVNGRPVNPANYLR